jgi:LemA protein
MLRQGFSRIAALVAVLVVAGTLAGCGVNNIPTYEEAAKAKWSEVLSQYKRRADLIPNLVETVKGFADQEKNVLTSVIEARAKASQAQINIPADVLTNPDAMKRFQDAQNSLGGALRQLMVVAERYPDIKSGQNFLALQSQLEGTENRIAIARRDYIEAVRVYNTELRTFPGVLWAATFFRANKPMAVFTASENSQTPPQVKF